MRTNNSIGSAVPKSTKKITDLIAELAELSGQQSAISARISEIAAQLGGATKPKRQLPCEQLGITPQAYAAGILLTQPDIQVAALAKRVGVSKMTLYRWPNISQILRGRTDPKCDSECYSDE